MTGNRFRVISLILLMTVFSLSPGVFAESDEISTDAEENQISNELTEYEEPAEEEANDEEPEEYEEADEEDEEDIVNEVTEIENTDTENADTTETGVIEKGPDYNTDTEAEKLYEEETNSEEVNDPDVQGSRANPSYIAIYGGVWDETMSSTTMEVGP